MILLCYQLEANIHVYVLVCKVTAIPAGIFQIAFISNFIISCVNKPYSKYLRVDEALIVILVL